MVAARLKRVRAQAAQAQQAIFGAWEQSADANRS